MRKRFLGLLTALCMVLSLMPASVSAASNVAIDAANFPDEIFRNYVSKVFDTDGNGSLSSSEIASVTQIHVNGMEIADLTGIEHFTALTSLNCGWNMLTELDVSQNTALQYLDCQGNRLRSLDVSKNTLLTSLDISYNDVSRLDLRKNTALTKLACEDNHMTDLDISENTSLISLNCNSNWLTDLDVSKNTALTDLICSSNPLITLDVSNCSALTSLDCFQTYLTSLNVSGCNELSDLRCEHNRLASLDVSKNTALEYLNCSDNQLTELDVSQNTALTVLYCSENQLTSMDVSSNTALTELSCYGSYTVTVRDGVFDLSTLPGNFDVNRASKWTGGTVEGTTLTVPSDVTRVDYTYDCGMGESATFTLMTGNSEFVSINTDNFPDAAFRSYVSEHFDKDGNGYLSEAEIFSVKEMTVADAEIISLQGIEYFTVLNGLDVSDCTELADLNCASNSLISLNISGCIALTSLDCKFNQLISLDVSSCTALEHLDCQSNWLKELDVSKNPKLSELRCGFNQLSRLDVSKNTALSVLSCNQNYLTDLDVSNNTALTELYCVDNHVTNLNVSRNIALTVLCCEYTHLSSLDVSKNTALTSLYCSDNQLTSLDVSKNTALTDLFCYNNQLTSLDVSKNSALAHLHCEVNQLTSLDVSKNTALTTLSCSYNQLTSLDVSKNTALTDLYCSDNQLTNLDISGCAALEYLSCDDNQRTIIMQDGIFDLSTLPGFDVSKASDWNGATVEGTTLTWTGDTETITYTYDCGREQQGQFALRPVPAGSVAVDKQQFPDAAMKQAMAAVADIDNDGVLTPEELECTTLDLSGRNITDLTGIEQFTQLEELDVSDNALAELKLAPKTRRTGTSLRVLDCSGNALTSLDLSGCPNLETLICEDNVAAFALPGTNIFDLSTLPGFDVSKAGGWAGGTVDGTLLTVSADQVTYTYDCGQGQSAIFTLEFDRGLPGDLDGDGKQTILDVMAVINIITGSLNATDTQTQLADMDGDGRVTILDAMALINTITGA